MLCKALCQSIRAEGWTEMHEPIEEVTNVVIKWVDSECWRGGRH